MTCPDCENPGCPCSEEPDEDEVFSYQVPLGDDARRLLGY